ncbi:plasmid recombination protein, partial [Clostridioides difficile]|uniref:plasmid recombination protein n=1 Tax=Clostridioides difficile TaxID=1496 RepID=UPI001596AAFD
MGYVVVHLMKIKSGAVCGIQSHNNREHEPMTNPDVVMSSSEDNYALIPIAKYKRTSPVKWSNLFTSPPASRKDALLSLHFTLPYATDTMATLCTGCHLDFLLSII